MTTEQKLKAVTDAMNLCNGEFWTMRMEVISDELWDESDNSWHILEILLDTEGLKAAYGERDRCRHCGNLKCTCDFPYIVPTFDVVAHDILDSWISGGAEEAINTAYDLLPS